MSPHVLIVGDPHPGGLPAFAGVIRCRFPSARIEVADGVETARDYLTRAEIAIDAVIVSEPHPDAWSPTAADRLIAAAPFATWLVWSGPWCAASGRSRGTWPVGVRIPWPDWARSLHRLERTVPLPITATREEVYRVGMEVDQPRSFSGTRVNLRIDSPDPGFRDLLNHWRIADGWYTDETKPTVRVIDLDPIEARLDRLATDDPTENALTLALTDWPVPERIRELEQVGVTEVLSKHDPLPVWSRAVERIVERIDTHGT